MKGISRTIFVGFFLLFISNLSIHSKQGKIPASPALSHPRLIFTSSELARLKSDPERVAAARRQAEAFLSKTKTQAWPDYFLPLPQVTMPPRHPGYDWPYWTPLGAELRMELEAISFGYAMTEDNRFLDRARTLLLSISDLPAWTDPDYLGGVNPCLDTFYITAGMAIAYDYLWSSLSADERGRIRRSIVEKGIGFIYSRADDPTSFVHSPSRWPNGHAMVIAALGIGALSVWGEEPKALDYLKLAVEKSTLFMTEEAKDDGALVEGFFYGAASIDPLVLFFAALKRNAGINLLAFPYFRKAHEYPLNFLIPGSNWLAGFGDNGGPRGTQPLFQGTVATLLREGLAGEEARYYLQQALKTKEEHPSYLKPIQQGMFYALRRTSPYRDIWPAEFLSPAAAPPGELPMAKNFASIGWVAMRSGWTDRDTLLAFRCGETIGHSHLDQNNFIIAGRGKVLASDPGYQRFNLRYPDEPNQSFTRHEHEFTHGSIGHNVILVDGEGQSKVAAEMIAFFDSPSFSYAAGEAAAAYPTLREFKRHIIQVKPGGYFVVYDEIATDGKSRKVDWLLQAGPGARFIANKAEIQINQTASATALSIVNEPAALSVSFPLSEKLSWSHRQYPDAAHLGHTVSTLMEGNLFKFLAAFEAHASEDGPALDFKARELPERSGFVLEARSKAGAKDIVLFSSRPAGSLFEEAITSDARMALISTSEAGEIVAWGMRAGSVLQSGARPLVVSSSPVDIGLTGKDSNISVKMKAPVEASLDIRLADFVSLRRNGLSVLPAEFHYDSQKKVLHIRIPAGEHTLDIKSGAQAGTF
jgi:hypothetical protein